MPEKQPVVLSIAGFDPSSGAGITADIKTIAAHGCYGVTCITAMTVQSTSGVRRVEALDPALVTDTLQELASDVQIDAVRIGMLGSGRVAKAVADFLSGAKGKGGLTNIVLDPILRSSSGAELLDSSGAKILKDRLLPLCDVVTPNIEAVTSGFASGSGGSGAVAMPAMAPAAFARMRAEIWLMPEMSTTE